MSTTGKADPDRGARFLQKLMTEDPAHLDVADDDEVERQMDAAGITVKSVPTAEELVALAGKIAATKAPKPATSVRPPARRPRPIAIAAAVALGAAGVVALANRGAIVAFLKGGEPIGPDTTWSAQQKAAAIRGEAFAACDAKRWTECGGKLDEAMALDPAGEGDARVVAARKAVSDATRPPVPPVPKEPDEKPPLKPGWK
ncbi:MAG TPA: hypothetical protein VGL81_26225 [Polyangiaceae bacterium]